MRSRAVYGQALTWKLCRVWARPELRAAYEHQVISPLSPPHTREFMPAPLHVAADEPEQAHMAATRVLVMLTVAQAWGYVHDDDIVEVQNTARLLHEATAP